MEKLTMIVDSKVKMFNIFSAEAKDLIRKLLIKDPKKRLGYGEDGINQIKSHPFFSKVDWQAIKSKKNKPQFVPKLSGVTDLSNIDGVFTKQDINETPTDESPLQSSVNFDQFSFNKKEESLLKN